MTDDAQSIRDMAEADAPEAVELFPLGSLEGDDASLDTMIRPGEPVTYTVSMNGTSEVPVPRRGMLDIRKEHMLLVTCEVAHPIVVPDREGDRATGKRITGWKVRQKLVPIYVEPVKGEAGAIEAAFADLLKADSNAAMGLLDRIKTRAENALGAPV